MSCETNLNTKKASSAQCQANSGIREPHEDTARDGRATYLDLSMHRLHNHASEHQDPPPIRLPDDSPSSAHPRSQDELASMLPPRRNRSDPGNPFPRPTGVRRAQGAGGVRIAGSAPAGREGVRRELHEAAAAYLLSVQPAGESLVKRRTGARSPRLWPWRSTGPGSKAIAGTVAGDDTIFIAAKTPRHAVRLTKGLVGVGGETVRARRLHHPAARGSRVSRFSFSLVH